MAIAILCTAKFARLAWTQTLPGAFTLHSWFFSLWLKPAIQPSPPVRRLVPPRCSSARTKMIPPQNILEHVIARLQLRTLLPLLLYANHRFTNAQLSYDTNWNLQLPARIPRRSDCRSYSTPAALPPHDRGEECTIPHRDRSGFPLVWLATSIRIAPRPWSDDLTLRDWAWIPNGGGDPEPANGVNGALTSRRSSVVSAWLRRQGYRNSVVRWCGFETWISTFAVDRGEGPGFA